MKIAKKIIYFALAIVMMITFASCGKNPSDSKAEKSAEDVYNSLFVDVDANNVISNLTFVASKDGYTITYDSSNTAVIANDGTVTRGNTDTKVFVVVTLTKDNIGTEFTKKFIVKASEGSNLPVIRITASKTVIYKDDSIALDVSVANSTEKAYTWSFSTPGILAISDTNVVTVVGIDKVKVDTSVTLTATLTSNSLVKQSITFTVKAPIDQGSVGDLTGAMIEEIANDSITVKGSLTDTYTDYKQSYNSKVQSYDMTVKMEDGKWSGAWNAADSDNVLTDIYVKGNEQVTDANKVTGHALKKLYVNKNNEVSSEIVKNYVSIPTIWESQHLWNHLGNLSVKSFKFDDQAGAYRYDVNVNDEDSLYLMTYLAISLTPMLNDTFQKLWLYIEDGHITKLIAQTEVLLYGGTTDDAGNIKDPDASSYTSIEVLFSNIGTTTVESPTQYDAPENVDLLNKALTTLKNTRNYTFRAVDTTTSAPSGDSSDYETSSTSNSSKVLKSKVSNNTSATGTVGTYGLVTSDATLFAKTIKYSYSMDGKDYRTEYSGYKKIDDASFDYFEYVVDSTTKVGTLAGKKKYNGDIFDIMPKFDFSANVFKFASSTSSNGKTLYTFELRESSIMRDIATEVSCYSYAVNAEATSGQKFTLVVDSDGNLISATYPYSIIDGTYMGYVKTTYSDINTTVIPEDTFDNYQPRVLKTSWNEYTVKHYTANGTTTSHDESAEIVFDATFGEDAKLIPTPSLFFNIVGDNFHGPFYNDITVGYDSDGNPINHGKVGITVTTELGDENSQMSDANFEALMAEFRVKLEEVGYSFNEGYSSTERSTTTRYVYTIENKNHDGGIEIVIENNGTKYLWIDFYILGDYVPKSAQ